jgi:CIC family chloride channel protein
VLSAVTGIVTGLGVALFEWVTRDGIFDGFLLHQPHWVRAFGPLVGLALAALLLHHLAGGASPATADEYIKNFHEPERRLDERAAPGRLLAGIATLGLGGALGFEGPSIYLGAAVGSGLQRRLSRFFSRQDPKLLLTAGAAAGVAAIFKAPATGAVFALEVPYQDDTARRMLLPALVAAASGYLAFVTVLGTEPLLPVRGTPPFNLVDLGGALVLGVLCGGGARAFAYVLRRAKVLAAGTSPLVRVVAAGVVIAALYGLSEVLFDEGLAIGSGYRTVSWSTDPQHGVVLVVALLLLRGAATVATVAGGGVGGLFIPLVVEGALMGRTVSGLFGHSGGSLFPVIGIAAFLGAGYRTPLAAVMFVAETTGRPGFVVPGLLAAVVAQLLMGRASVSPYQQAARAGHLERRFELPVTAAVRTDVLTAPPDTTLTEVMWNHLLGARQRVVPVVDGTTFLGVVRVEDLRSVPHEEWDTATVADVMHADVPVAAVSWRVRDAVAAMEAADVDRLAVVDATGCFVGMVSTGQLLKLDEILDRAGDEQG